MTPPSRSAIARWTEQFLQSMVSLWPDESREWGRALAAEAAQIDRPFEAARWAVGGGAFFLRSLGAHFLAWTRLPAGGNSPSVPGGSEPPLPKHSRLTTALLLLTAGFLLLLPWGREAKSSMGNLWLSLGGFDSQRRDVESLARRGGKGKNAEELALAAITHPDTTRGMQLASQAVAIDPSLTWIYSRNFGQDCLPSNWLAALQSYDPQNGYPLLMAANARAQSAFLALVSSHSPRRDEVERLLAQDAQWRELMRQAVHASRYDDYSLRQLAFVRHTWSRNPSLPPAMVIFSMWRLPIPDILFLRSYTKLRIREAQQAQSRGEWQAAEQSLNELRAFGQRMAAKDQTAIEQLAGVEVSGESLLALRSFYLAGNRSDQVRTVDQTLEELQERRNSLLHWDGKAYFALTRRYRRWSIGVQLSAFGVWLGAFAAAASIAFLEIAALAPKIRRKFCTRLACFLADYAPPFLPLAVLGLLISFRPFAAAATQFRSGSGAFADDRYFPSICFLLQPQLVSQPFPSAAYYLWWLVTLALAGTAIFVTVRGIVRQSPASLL